MTTQREIELYIKYVTLMSQVMELTDEQLDMIDEDPRAKALLTMSEKEDLTFEDMDVVLDGVKDLLLDVLGIEV